MDRLAQRQAAFNATSRDQGVAFAEHRRHLTRWLMPDLGLAGTRLGILGAGNSNDLDLPSLVAAHREVHLVDLDADALAHGVVRQGLANHPGLRLHGGLDVTATLDLVAGWTHASELQDADLAALTEWPTARVAPVLPGDWQVVASTCLLSQILETASHALGRDHPQLARVEAALVLGHLRLLTRLVVPGSTALLVTEVVSSATLPGLANLPDEALAPLLPELARTGNHFRGLHPRQLQATLRADPALGPRIEARSLPPWRWRLHDRTYLVSGLRFSIGVDQISRHSRRI